MFAFIFLTVFCYFRSIQGLFELPQNLAATGVLGEVSNQIFTGNDSKLREFADIFNHYVNLTLLEKEGRKVLSKLTTEDSAGDDETQGLYGSLAWKTALNDALDEDNITVEFNKPLHDEVIEYIKTFASNPENLKALYLLYQQRLDSDSSHPNSTTFEDDDLNTYKTDPDKGEALDNDTATENDAFWDDTPTRRIYKGVPTKIKLYPFIVSVLMFDTFACAGSIIKNDLVITAASCLQLAHNNRFFRENPIFVSVRVGSLYFAVGGEVVHVTEIFFHPMYDPKTLHNNLAVMRLRKVLNFKRRNVKKIDFDKNAAALSENTPPITILGWGAKTHSNKLYFHGRLQVTTLDYYDKQSCRDVYGKIFVTKTNFCAGFISTGEGACNRDVGDPGVSGRFLVGVTSFGSPICGQADTPTVFTKLGYYADWIQDIMDQKVPRLSHSTTTTRPFRVLNKPIILYGLGSEHEPIPIQREGLDIDPAQDTAAVDADLQIVQNELQKLGVPNEASANLIQGLRTGGTFQKVDVLPFEEQDPEIKYNGPNTDNIPIRYITDSDKAPDEEGSILREDDRDEEESSNQALQETNAIENQWSGSDSDGPTMNPVDRATKLNNFDMKQESREVRKTDIENDLRILKAPEINYNLNFGLDVSEAPASAKKVVSNLEEPMSTETDVNNEENFNKSRNKNHNLKNDKTLRKKHRIPSLLHSQLQEKKHSKDSRNTIISNTINKEGSDGKHILDTPNIVQSKEEIHFADVDKQQGSVDKNSLEEHHESIPHEKEIKLHEHPDTAFQNDIADDIVKREIQKLIEQLEISSELNSETEERNSITNSPLRNKLKIDTDGTKDSDTVLTFLYLTDNEKKMQLRANTDSSDEGLSIDAAPFKGNLRHARKHSNNLVGNSEIYEIFANVMNTVVNKTVE